MTFERRTYDLARVGIASHSHLFTHIGDQLFVERDMEGMVGWHGLASNISRVGCHPASEVFSEGLLIMATSF